MMEIHLLDEGFTPDAKYICWLNLIELESQMQGLKIAFVSREDGQALVSHGGDSLDLDRLSSMAAGLSKLSRLMSMEVGPNLPDYSMISINSCFVFNMEAGTKKSPLILTAFVANSIKLENARIEIERCRSNIESELLRMNF